MLKKKIGSLVCFLICLSATRLQAQRDKSISGHFEGRTLTQLVEKIEPITGCKFYFDPSETDSLNFNLTVTDQPLNNFLETVFRNTDLKYAIDTTVNQVFITKGLLIRTTLPKGLFKTPANPADKEKDTATVALTNPGESEPEPEPNQSKNRLSIAAENKLIIIGDNPGATNRPGKATIAGYVKDAKTGEPIVGAFISVDTLSITVMTDQFGYYSLTIPRGRHLIRITNAGMKAAGRQVQLNADGKLNIDMQEYVASLTTVVVAAEKNSNTKSLQMGTNRLSIQTIKKVPVVFGEADVIKVVLTLPGVTSVGEASTGFNVRGGSTDQNLVLFDDATVYNPTHLFGFFAAFNPEVVKGIELYKSAIPAKYGGRLSSVLDVSMLDGNSKKWSGTAGIGPLTSKFVIEGPLVKDKTSIIAGFRTTYSNWLLKALHNTAYSNSRANFDDANFRISHTIDAKNSLYIMGYYSSDRFKFNNDTTYTYSNRNANIKWKHIFNNKSFGLFSAGYDNYRYGVSNDQDSLNAFKLGFDITQTWFRTDLTYNAGNKHAFTYGFDAMHYQLNPGYYKPVDGKSLAIPNTVPSEHGLESALYLADQYTVSPGLTINAGIRFSMFNYLGAHDEYNYAPGLPRDTTTIIDTTRYNSGKFIKTYTAPEIRLSARYSLSDNASVKISYNTLQQYIHMMSNTVAISPTDIWKLSDPHLKPQSGDQLSLGYYRNFKANTIETSVEVYYKRINHYLDYKSGASLVLNHHIETDVFNTKGKAYGVEFLIKRLTGRLNGWFSYSWSRTFLKQDDPLAGETINEGKYYPASFDKPHNVNLIANYRFSHRYSVSLNVVYSTGRPITLPLAVFTLGGSPGLYYSERNQYRVPDYFRTDISVNIEGGHKLKKATHNYWSAGIYNLTGRQNAYSVYFTQENGLIKGYKLSIFGTLIPFVTYNIKF